MKNNKRKNRIILCILLIMVVCLLTPNVRLCAADTGIRPTAAALPDGTIIIGVYIIDLNALTAEIQKLAEDSAAGNRDRTAQRRIYYKSELNSGCWYDITDAKGIEEISTSKNNLVSNQTIDQLKLEYYVKADGTILSFATGAMVAAGSIEQKTNTLNMPELDPIISQLPALDGLIDALEEMDLDEDDEEDEENIALLNAYYRERNSIKRVIQYVSDDTTTRINEELRKMEASIKKLKDNESIEVATKVKMKKKTMLEIHCYEVVAQRLLDEISYLGKADNLKHGNLIGTDGDIYSEIIKKLDELRATTGDDDTSAVGEAMTKADEKMEEALLEGNQASIEQAVDKARAFNALLSGATEGVALDKELATAIEAVQAELFQTMLDNLSDEINDILSGAAEIEDSTAEKIKELDKEILGKIDEIYAMNRDAANKQELLDTYTDALNQLSDKLGKEKQNKGAQELAGLLSKASSESKVEAKLTGILASKEVKKLSDKLSELKKQAENAHEKYMEAVEKGDSNSADQWKATEDELLNRLDELDTDNKKILNEQLTKTFDTKEETETAIAMVNAYASLLGEVDKGLYHSLASTKEDLQKALEKTDSSDIANAYQALINAAENVGKDLISDENKTKLLEGLTEGVEKATRAAGESGNIRLKDMLSNLAEELEKDIHRAKEGTLLYEPENNLADIILPEGQTSETEEYDIFAKYELVCVEKGLYLNGYRYQENGITYVPLRELAEQMGSQVINYGNIIIIKDNQFQLECEEGSPNAYVDDKLRLLEKAPELINGRVCITAQLFAECYGMELIIHENTLIMK